MCARVCVHVCSHPLSSVNPLLRTRPPFFLSLSDPRSWRRSSTRLLSITTCAPCCPQRMTSSGSYGPTRAPPPGEWVGPSSATPPGKWVGPSSAPPPGEWVGPSSAPPLGEWVGPSYTPPPGGWLWKLVPHLSIVPHLSVVGDWWICLIIGDIYLCFSPTQEPVLTCVYNI